VVAVMPDRRGLLQEGKSLVILVRREIDFDQHRLGTPGKAGLLLDFVGFETGPFSVLIALLEHVYRSHIIQSGGNILGAIELLTDL
jgi:hypothetical protein